MATFYIQLENKLLQISGELTAENISKALGYVPVSPNVTDELSQRVDNITFDSLKDNPFLQDGSGELNIVDEAGNIIAKIDAEGIHSVDFIAGTHKLSEKTDKIYVDEAVKNVKVDLTGYATEEYVNNIDFYNINNNPIVNNGDGKLLFVDENGYIGLQLEEDGLYVKDVIADGHTLSQKADKSELSNYATKDEVSDLVAMSVVEELQGKVNTLVGEDSDKSVRTIANEELTALLLAGNDNLQSLQELAAWIDEHPEDASAMNEAIKTNTSNITKLDTAYKEADTKVLTDANEYTDNINFYTIKDNPIVNGEAGSLTFVDETGYIGLKVTEEGIIAKDVVTPEHKLSDKANTSDIPTKVSQLQNDANYITTADIPSLDEYITETELTAKGYTTNIGTITGIKMNGASKGTSGVVDLGTVITSHQDISGKLDASVAAATYATKAEVPQDYLTEENVNEYIYAPIINHGTSDGSFALTANEYHVWGLMPSLTLTLAEPSDPTIYNEYMFEFASGSTATTLSLPSTVKWVSVPDIQHNKIYQVSIVNNLGVIGGFSNE